MTRALSILLAVLMSASACSAIRPGEAKAARRPPNIVLILADDLGYGELGCYGQERIRTPHIDGLASQGMRFTRAYAGAPVCAPSRCVLLTGRHLAHAQVRGNREVQPEGQHPLEAGTVTVASLLRDAGYVTAAVGKWGLGPVGSSGDPNARGFDHVFGYNCQRQAHSYFPDHLWRNGERVEPREHPFLVWEFHGYGGQKAALMGRWKAVLRDIHRGGEDVELYDLATDPGEEHDVAAQHPDQVARARELFATERTPNAAFPMAAFDGEPAPER